MRKSFAMGKDKSIEQVPAHNNSRDPDVPYYYRDTNAYDALGKADQLPNITNTSLNELLQIPVTQLQMNEKLANIVFGVKKGESLGVRTLEELLSIPPEVLVTRSNLGEKTLLHLDRFIRSVLGRGMNMDMYFEKLREHGKLVTFDRVRSRYVLED